MYVRPISEYNSVIWSPVLKKDIVSIEKVRRRFTKRLPSLKNLSLPGEVKSLEFIQLRTPSVACRFGYVL